MNMNEHGAAIVLALGAVHVEACVPLLIQCATARPDAPAALLVLTYTRAIFAFVDKVRATRPALPTRHAAVVQAIRGMEVASGRNGKAVARLCAPPYPFVAWFFIVSYAVAFMHCNTCISILMLCYVYLPAIIDDLSTTLSASFAAVCDAPSSVDSLVTPVLRALLSVISTASVDDMETSSVTSDSDDSSDGSDESLNLEEDDASDSEVMEDCSQDLFERVGNFIFGAAHERTSEECKELALRRRRQDPRPDIARPSPEYLLELKEEEAWQQLQQQRAAARRRRARFPHILLSSPPMPYQLGYIAFPPPDPPCSDPADHAPQSQPVEPPQPTSFTRQPIAQGFTFVNPAAFSAWSNNSPNQAFSSFTSSPFAASASAFELNNTSTTSTYQNIPNPSTANDTPAQAGQASSFVDPATYTPPPSNPFAAYASASSPFATSASAFGFNKTSTPPRVQNGTTPWDVGGFQPPANQPLPSNGPFQFVDPAVRQAMNQPTAQNPATAQRNEEGYEVIDEKSYYAAPAPAPAQPGPEQPAPVQTNANVLRDEEGYEIINENAYYATNIPMSDAAENPASSTPTVQNVTTPASAASALPSTPLPVNTTSAITAPASLIQNHTPVYENTIIQPARRTSPFTPTSLNAQVHTPEALPDHISPAISVRARSSPILSTSALLPVSPAVKTATSTPTPSIPTQAEPSPSTPVNVASMALPASSTVPSNTIAATTAPPLPISLPSLVFSAPLVLSPPAPGRRSRAPSPPSLPDLTTANQGVVCERDGHERQPLGLCTQCKIVADGKRPKKVVFYDPLEDEIAQTLGSGERDNARAMPDMSDDEDGSASMSLLNAAGDKPRKALQSKRDFQHADAAALSQRKLRALPKARTTTNTGPSPVAPALSAVPRNAAQDAAAPASQSCLQVGPSASASAAPVSTSTTTAPSVSAAAAEESDEHREVLATFVTACKRLRRYRH